MISLYIPEIKSKEMKDIRRTFNPLYRINSYYFSSKDCLSLKSNLHKVLYQTSFL